MLPKHPCRWLLILSLLIPLMSACIAADTPESQTSAPLDASTAVVSDDGKMLWFDALALGIDGQGWKEVAHPYDRFPAEAKGIVRDAVWSLSENSAGMSVRFITDSPMVSARWSLRTGMLDMHHMPSTGVSGVDLYAKDPSGQWRWVGAGRPEAQHHSEATLVSSAPKGLHEYQLYLPLYNGIEKLEIGIEAGAELHQGPAYTESHTKPVLFWGTSILQGGCASRPGMAYPSIIGRRLQRPVVNLGFSGNGRMDPEIVELIAKLDVAAYVIDCGPNMTAAMIAERTEPLVRGLREAQPTTPVVLVENIKYQRGWFVESTRNSYVEKNIELRAAYDRLRAEGVEELYYIPCDDLLGNDAEATVDGVHATDLGFMRMADEIGPVVAEVLE